MSGDHDGADFFDMLGQMSEFRCPSCGETTSGYAETCEVCGAELGLEKDDASLDLVAGAEARAARLQKTSMSEAKNLNRLTDALSGLESGALSVDDYLAVVEDILTMVESAVELYRTPFMKKQLSEMEPDAAKIYSQMATAANDMLSGLQKMRQSDDLNQARAGLQAVEAALWKVDAAQDVALERAEQEQLQD